MNGRPFGPAHFSFFGTAAAFGRSGLVLMGHPDPVLPHFYDQVHLVGVLPEVENRDLQLVDEPLVRVNGAAEDLSIPVESMKINFDLFRFFLFHALTSSLSQASGAAHYLHHSPD